MTLAQMLLRLHTMPARLAECEWQVWVNYWALDLKFVQQLGHAVALEAHGALFGLGGALMVP